MDRIRNQVGATFIAVRGWVVPAGVLIFWFATAVSAVSQLITIEPALKTIPAVERAAPERGRAHPPTGRLEN